MEVPFFAVYQSQQSPWQAKYNRKERNKQSQRKLKLRNIFYIILKNAFHGKTTEYIRERMNLDSIDKVDAQKLLI